MRRDPKNRNTLTFSSTGKRIYVCHGIIGIDSNLSVYEGWDGELEGSDFRKRLLAGEMTHLNLEEEKEKLLTPEERMELAQEMIDLWSRYLKEAVDDFHDEVKVETLWEEKDSGVCIFCYGTGYEMGNTRCGHCTTEPPEEKT